MLESVGYEYDLNGKRTSMDRLNVTPKLPVPVSNTTYDDANRMLTINGQSLTYDLNGNLIQKGDTTYVWDARNRLVQIVNPSMTASFKYDALNRRIEKTVNGRTTQYLYDGLDIIQEIEDGMVSANYIRSLNIDEPLARLDMMGGVRFYHTDALGSVIASFAGVFFYCPIRKISVERGRGEGE